MRLSFLLLSVFLSSITLAQTGIRGTIKSSDGEELPFSTIYIKGTTNGTTSNERSAYFLRTPPGKHTIVVQYVGYAVLERQITVSEGQMIEIDFILDEQALQLQTVTITANDDNPANRVIREAIKKRKFYENEVRAFKNDAYIKGLFRLLKRPDKILGQTITVDTGILYLSESVSEFAFERPDKISERMISSKVSGNEQGFSFNQASDFNINAYEKSYKHDILGERVFVSPISNQAFIFYDFEWLGAFEEDGKLINKIRLLPKRSTDPAFEGVVYIVEDTWKFHTIDLLATKARGIEFTDSLRINQVFAPTQNDIWMPILQKFEFQFGGFGFKGKGYYLGVYSNYVVEPNYELYKEEELFEETFQSEPEKDLFAEKDFTREVLYVEEGSNKRDSSYWENIRPIPLTMVEVEDYRVKDSVRFVKESVPYKDSVDRERNKLTVGNVLLSGYNHSNSVAEKYWSLPSIQSMLQFNTVEGLVTEFQPTIWSQNDERTTYWFRPSLRYGFSSEKLYAKLDASYRFLDDKFTRIYFGGGNYVSQFNEDAITPFINTYVTLVRGDNYMKLFQKSFGYVRFQQELVNGIRMNARLEYASRDTLSNTKDYTWVSDEKRTFTPNQPYSEELNGGTDGAIGTGFPTSKAVTASATFRIRFNQRYATRPDRKFIYSSKYPELFVTLKKGLADINYDFVSVRVQDDISLGLSGSSTYSVEAGSFLNANSLTFVDFKHFSGNQTSLSQVDKRYKFELLPFYAFSTKDSYLEAHFEHHFNEFIFNKIPLVKKLNLQAVGSVNYLNTKALGNYVELGAGIEHIFKFMRVDYWWAFRDGSSAANGFRIGVGF
ncbi:MAG: DUF5686 and carboxypeptidase regulatory-like domain-containing protein [Cyclobacteriaceae bacterium]